MTGNDSSAADGAAVAAATVAELARRFDVVEVAVAVDGRTLRIARPRSAEDLIDEDAFAADERLPYWAELWPSSIALAAAVARMRGERARLLELGCGLGLVSAVAAQVGFHVTATDYYADALAFTRVNVQANAGTVPHTRLVDWRALASDLGRFDVVLASDVLYERPYAALVAGALAQTLASDGTAVVADPGRVAAEPFLDEIRRRGLVAESPREVPHIDGVIRQTIRLYVIRHAESGLPAVRMARLST